jgi:hypothetical protein
MPVDTQTLQEQRSKRRMMEDGDVNEIHSPVSDEIDLNETTEAVEEIRSVSQGSDDSSMSAKVLSAAASAGKTIEETIHKVVASADEVLHPPHEGEENSPSPEESNVEDKADPEPVSAKVMNAATSAGKTVVDLSISAAKITGDAFHKVVESATEVMHKHKSSGSSEEKETPSPEPTSAPEETPTEDVQEPVSTKVLHAASAAGKTVVDLSMSAAKYTGEVIHKVATSAGEVLHKEKSQTPPTDTEKTDDAQEPHAAVEGEASPQPSVPEESQGVRMWSSVRRMSEKVLSTTSNTISKAAASVHAPKDPDTKPEAEPAPESDERGRSGSINQLWSTVRNTASAAIKAAEPVAISTASAVSHSAQTVWSTTKEVFSAKKTDPEEDSEVAQKPEEEEEPVPEPKGALGEEKNSDEAQSTAPVVTESEGVIEEQTGVEPEIESSPVESVVEDESGDGEGGDVPETQDSA